MKVYNFEENPQAGIPNLDEQYMQEALKLAKKAFEEDEIPIGAIIVSNGKIIGKGYNMTERLNDVTAHAEMQAFTAAANYLGGKYLKDCTLYVTVEPCVMCAGVILAARLPRVVFGAWDEKAGAVGSVYDLLRDGRLPHPVPEVVSGVRADECAAVLAEFFAERR